MSNLLQGGFKFRALNFLFLSLALAGISSIAPACAKNFTITAPGDGTTDDTDSIRSTLTAASLYPNSKVTFPPGTYVVSDQITANGVTLVGNSATLSMTGSGTIALQGQSAGLLNLTVTNSGSSSTAGVSDSALSGSITGCSFSGWNQSVNILAGNATVTGSSFSVIGNYYAGIYITQSAKTTIKNNTFTSDGNSYAYGVEGASGANDVVVESNTFNACYGAGVLGYTNQDYQGTYLVTKNTFTGCYFALNASYVGNATFSGNTVNAGTTGWYGFSGGDNDTSTVTNNTFNSMPSPIYSSGIVGGSTISGNTMTGGGGINVQNQYAVVIKTNNITCNGNNDGIDVQYANSVQITGNTVSSCIYGIYDYGSGIVTVQNNTIDNTSHAGIYLDLDETEDKVASNTLKNVGTSGGNSGLAAIFVLGAEPVVVTGNSWDPTSSYTLPTYYIYASASSVTLKGNKTTTLQPNGP